MLNYRVVTIPDSYLMFSIATDTDWDGLVVRRKRFLRIIYGQTLFSD